MSGLLAVARTGLDAAARHPLRSFAAVSCVVAVLAPYLAGVGIARGLADQAAESVSAGADLYVTGLRFGRDVPVPISAIDVVRAAPGVTEVVPRIVAEVRIGKERESAVLVGLPASRFPTDVRCVEGRLPAAGAANELAFGSQIAARLGLSVGSAIPPFYRNDAGERVSTVVGVFRADLPVWAANLVLADFETAERVCASRGLASGLLVSCRPEYRDAVREAITRLDSLGAKDDPGGPIRARAVTREDAAAFVPAGVLHREGVFNLHFVLAFAVAIPLVLVTSGVGLAERRRETGVLKALGWHTDEILVRGVAESLVLAAAGAAVSVLIASAWLVLFNGRGIAGVYLAGTDVAPGLEVPFRLTPEPVLVAAALSFVVTSTGTLLSTWRAAVAAPMEAMK
jgi:ABC-type lipoprotein release transport system permease subunit